MDKFDGRPVEVEPDGPPVERKVEGFRDLLRTPPRITDGLVPFQRRWTAEVVGEDGSRSSCSGGHGVPFRTSCLAKRVQIRANPVSGKRETRIDRSQRGFRWLPGLDSNQ